MCIRLVNSCNQEPKMKVHSDKFTGLRPFMSIAVLAVNGHSDGPTYGLGWPRFKMFHHPAWAVG